MSIGADVFLSYTWSDLALAEQVQTVLEGAGITVFRDVDIGTFDPITLRLADALDRAKLMLAVYSRRYPTRYACQWELTRAFLAGQHAGDPRDRVLVVNPEVDESHIQPLELEDAGYLSVAGGGLDAAQLVARVKVKLAAIDGPIGASRPARRPHLPERVLRNRRFVGRHREMWRAHSELRAGRARAVRRPVASRVAVVRGFTGTGKTWLAEQYAFLFQDAYPGGVFWADLSGAARAEDAVSLFGTQLKEVAVHDLRLDVEGVEAARLRPLVARHLIDEGQDVLWIVDDLPPGMTGDVFEELVVGSPRVHVLATSRESIEGWGGPVVEMAGLSELEAQELFDYDWIDLSPADREAVSRLVVRCGGHPLVLATTSGSLRNSQGAGNDHVAAALDRASGTVVDALRLRITELPADVLAVLTTTTVLSAAPFTRDLLVRALTSAFGAETESAVSRALDVLDDRSLIQRLDRVDRVEGPQSWQVHMLVVEAVRHEVPVDVLDACRRTVAGVLLDVLDNAGNEVPYRHARELARLDAVPTDLRVRLLRSVTGFHRRRADPLPADDAATALLDVKRAAGVGGVDDLLLGARTALEAGHFDAAYQRGSRACELAAADDNFRAEYRARFLTAQACDHLGRYDRADEVYRHHPRARRAAGPPRWMPEEERAAIEVAEVVSLRVRGEVGEALDLAADLVSRLPSGTRHDRLDGAWSDAMIELARLQLAAGEVLKARRTSAELVEVYRKEKATEHARSRQAVVLHAEAQLHVAFREMPSRKKVWDRAVREIGALHAQNAHRYGDDNPLTLESAVLEAKALLDNSRIDEARELLARVEPRIARVLGPDHPLAHRARFHVGMTYQREGDWPPAIAVYRELLPHQVATLGPNHVDALVTRLQLGVCLSVVGQAAEAKSLVEEAMHGLRRFGWAHEPTMQAYVATVLGKLPAPALSALHRIVRLFAL
ncbi:TIR domain-containing protein [Actinosynnema sp. NPDC091369]